MMQRVAAYCRVSTDKSDQVNSLESQKKYFTEYVERNPYWQLTIVYSDDGVTGTSTKKRHSFNKMIEDAVSGKFDLIITKEISRFARNTLDSIYYTRKLKELGIGVIFMNDNINTLDSDAELRLTIMSSIAQEESRKTSERVKWGQKRRMEAGVVFGCDMLGYDVRGGNLIIEPNGAEVVKLIFHKFVNEGKGTHVIARELREAGISTAKYMKTWSNVVILRIIRNEKYCGDLIQSKTYTPSYLSHEKRYNKGEKEFVVLRNHHEPIISRELFDSAQRELERRSPSEERKAKYSNRYCFSGKIKCGICNSSFVSRSKKLKDNSVYKAWRCFQAATYGSIHNDKKGNQVGCNCPSLNNEDAKYIVRQVVKNLFMDKDAVINQLVRAVKQVLNMDSNHCRKDDLQNRFDKLSTKKQGLIEMYLNKEISKNEFHMLTSKFEQEIKNLEQQIKDKEKQVELQKNQDQILEDITDNIKGLSFGEIWDDTFYRNILDKIVVYDDKVINIYLNLISSKWSYQISDLSKIKKSHNDSIASKNTKHLKNTVNSGFSDFNERTEDHNDTSVSKNTKSFKTLMNTEFFPKSSDLFDTSLGTEELGHAEMISAIIYQLTRNLTMDEIKRSGFDTYFVDHTTGVYPIAASGVPFDAKTFAVKGDVIADLVEDLAAEQKARVSYDNILRLVDDHDVRDPIKFLRQREIVHFQRFGDALRVAQDNLDSKNFYAFNPEFDRIRK